MKLVSVVLMPLALGFAARSLPNACASAAALHDHPERRRLQAMEWLGAPAGLEMLLSTDGIHSPPSDS